MYVERVKAGKKNVKANPTTLFIYRYKNNNDGAAANKNES